MTHPPRALGASLLASTFLAACSSGGGSNSLSRLPDADGDGLPDRLERTLGSDPRDAEDPFVEGAQDDDTPEGPGPDAIPDGLERYLRAGGSAVPITALTDSDADGVSDYLEIASGLDPRDPDEPALDGAHDKPDSGGPAFDGISDGLESYLLRRGARPPLTQDSDSDGDGIPDFLEARSGSDPFAARDPAYARAFDLDRDQVPDWLELGTGSDPLLADFPTFDGADDDDGGELGPDGDGVKDGLEGFLFRAGAARPVSTATDSDADRLPDVAEVRAGFDPFRAASPRANGAGDEDGDGIANSLEALLLLKGARAAARATDSDGDRIADFAEVLSGSDPFERSEPTLFSHFDLDQDGLFDFLEYELGSDALQPHSPLVNGALDLDDSTGPARDPLSDALEGLLIARGSRAPVTTYSDADADGVPDFVELRWVSDALDPDSPIAQGARDEDDAGGPAGDGISDAAEQVLILLGAGGPQDAARNSDGDVIPDAIELVTGSNWLDTNSPRPNKSPDVDGDGAADYLELVLGFDPRSADDPISSGGNDSDQDGLSDALEELLRLTSTPVPVTPESDSDGDGLYDYLEVRLASERHDGDSPVQNGGADRDDPNGPAGDGISDALEHFLIRSGAARPVTPRSDSDGDVIPDYLEVRLALDAFDASSPLADGSGDADGDGVSNALEFVLARLGAAPPIDGRTDSDLDGAPDHLEFFAGADPFDPDSPVPSGAADTDGDGIPDALEAVLFALGARAPVTPQSDTDQDGIPDFYEVRSGTHPVRGDHPLANGGADVLDASGPRDTISDAFEVLLISQGADAPVTRASDSDHDAAPEHLEVFAGSLPFDANSPVANGAGDGDGDLLSDALEEVLVRLGATPPIAASTDTDRDGAPDGFEVETAAHPLDGDVPIRDGDGASFDLNATTGPNGDGISDALELLLIQIGSRAPLGAENDIDLDGLPDYFEVRSGTRVLDPDSPIANGGADTDDSTSPAGDVISDALEAVLIARGATGPVTLTTDTDGDGVPDYYEVFKGSDPFDGADEVAPGTKPIAFGLAIDGIDRLGRTLTGTYRYADAERDPEGPTRFRWLRDGIPIPGELAPTHVISAEDSGKTLDFEVTPVALYSWPPETQAGEAVRTAHSIPVLFFPRGTGGPGGVGLTDGRSDVRLWLRASEGVTTEGGEVTKWSDQSGYRRDASAVDTRRPDLVDGVGPRLAPAVRFDGASHLGVPSPVDDDLTLVAAFATTSTAGNPNQTWWVTPAILGGETPNCRRDYHLGLVSGRPLFVVREVELLLGASYADGMPHALMGWRLNAAEQMGLVRRWHLARQRDGADRRAELPDVAARRQLDSHDRLLDGRPARGVRLRPRAERDREEPGRHLPGRESWRAELARAVRLRCDARRRRGRHRTHFGLAPHRSGGGSGHPAHLVALGAVRRGLPRLGHGRGRRLLAHERRPAALRAAPEARLGNHDHGWGRRRRRGHGEPALPREGAVPLHRARRLRTAVRRGRDLRGCGGAPCPGDLRLRARHDRVPGRPARARALHRAGGHAAALSSSARRVLRCDQRPTVKPRERRSSSTSTPWPGWRVSISTSTSTKPTGTCQPAR